MHSPKHLITFYRPQRFSELKGQGSVKKVLMRSAKEGRIANAYIFSGTRGVGKTSVARIFAKAINCRNAPCEEPCNKCDICNEITKGISLDVMEIDGASHTGVDNIRKLIEDISLSPIKCKYRVIIIDEVHMLSRSAFNALLKTLEEPPPHVVFILATTEIHKIPATIKSRCQQFVFKKLTTNELVEHLKEILEKESISYEEEALHVLAKKGGGSVRDSLSMLSQLITISEGKITSSLVREVLGIASQEIKLRLVEFMAKRDLRSIVNEIKELLEQGIDIPYFLKEFSMLWRDLFFIKSMGLDMSSEIESSADVEELKRIASFFSLSQIHAAWQMLVNTQTSIDRLQDPVLHLELLFVNMAYLPDLIPITRSKEIIENRDIQMDLGTGDDSIYQEEVSLAKRPEGADLDKKENYKALTSETRSRGAQQNAPKTWKGFLDFLERDKKIKEFPHVHICDGKIEGNNVFIKCPEFWLTRLKSDPNRYLLFQDMVKDFFGKNIKLVFNIIQNQDKNSIKKKVMQDPIVQEVIDKFNARLVDVYAKKE